MRGVWVYRKRFGSDPVSQEQIDEAFGPKLLRTLTHKLPDDAAKRPGKTAWEHATGVHARHLQNVQAAREDNRGVRR